LDSDPITRLNRWLDEFNSTREIIPRPAIKQATGLLLVGPAPLFEEERYARRQALVSDLDDP
jgi:hypothetical protein